MARASWSGILNKAVLISAIGYFVDLYDLILFNVVKEKSLNDLGFFGESYQKLEVDLMNYQMWGMLTGGLIWGILGDRKGRASVLFGSILMYSLANIANAFVTNIPAYSLCRFVAGVGLAGELGAGITLVLESMDKEKRGYGTMLIVTLGALGAVVASQVGQLNWKIAYIIGGVMGLLILFLRVRGLESGMFKEMEGQRVNQGNLFMLFKPVKRFIRYLSCILIGLPVWFTIGILVNLSKSHFAFNMGLDPKMVNMGTTIMFTYLGLSIGDLISGMLSQVFRNRKKVIFGYLTANALLCLIFLFSREASLNWFYFLCFMLGSATGYWALFVTVAAEQFGTNIRSTVANTVPNFVRGALPLISASYLYFRTSFLGDSVLAALVVGFCCLLLAFLGTAMVNETFGKDLSYLEEHQ
jgi:MFS family permease